MPKVTIAQNILAANDTIAEEIQELLAARGIRTINVMSSPGAGKTTLLERTIERLHEQLGIAVIEGDIETSADAERIEAAGAETVQINTRGACHLEAHMIRAALEEIDLTHISLLVIENIGNLVCPSAWNLGEDLRVVVVSTSEGDDKPAKYPQMFAASQVMIVNKLDLLPYVDYNVTGLDVWCEWLMGYVSVKPGIPG